MCARGTRLSAYTAPRCSSPMSTTLRQTMACPPPAVPAVPASPPAALRGAAMAPAGLWGAAAAAAASAQRGPAAATGGRAPPPHLLLPPPPPPWSRRAAGCAPHRGGDGRGAAAGTA